MDPLSRYSLQLSSRPPEGDAPSRKSSPVDRLLTVLSLDRISFHELSMRRRVLLSQLPLFVTTVVLVAGIWVVHEPLRGDLRVQLALALTVALTALCVLVPWDRLPYGAFLAVPVLDFVPITLLREGTLSTVTGVGIMAAFPCTSACPGSVRRSWADPTTRSTATTGYGS